MQIFIVEGEEIKEVGNSADCSNEVGHVSGREVVVGNFSWYMFFTEFVEQLENTKQCMAYIQMCVNRGLKKNMPFSQMSAFIYSKNITMLSFWEC